MSYEDAFIWEWEDDNLGLEEYIIQCDNLEGETDKAYLLTIGNDEYWFPKSQCQLDKKSLELTLPLWLIEEKQLEDFVDYD
jgi:hypothetical protein